MKESPDLSRIISVIMENPDIVNQISSLLSNSEEKTDAKKTEVKEGTATEAIIREEDTDPIEKNSKSAKRKQLLSAMKPYLSEDRARAVDSMMTIADVLSMMRGK